MPPHKTGKKHATKHAAKHADKRHGPGKDIRRAYEHLGRLEALQDALRPEAVDQVHKLTVIAQQILQADDARSAADLLRAAEHLSFATLAPASTERVDRAGLIEALTGEFDHLRSKAQEHWDDGSGETDAILLAIYHSALVEADSALRGGSYRRAMEFARAAEALAHVDTNHLKRRETSKQAARLHA